MIAYYCEFCAKRLSHLQDYGRRIGVICDSCKQRKDCTAYAVESMQVVPKGVQLPSDCDYEQTRQLLTTLKIPFHAVENKMQMQIKGREYFLSITIDHGAGYTRAEAEFYFDREGNFLAHGVWPEGTKVPF